VFIETVQKKKLATSDAGLWNTTLRSFFYKRPETGKSSDYKTIAWKNEVSSKVRLEVGAARILRRLSRPTSYNPRELILDLA